MSRKLTLSFGKLSVVNLIFLSKEFIKRSSKSSISFSVLKVRCHQHIVCMPLFKNCRLNL